MEVAHLLRQVEKLRWRLGRPVEGLLVGAYRSRIRGEGVEFADTRPYQPGEPWRRIHWGLSARRNQPYLWLGTEERLLTCLLALDLSASMREYAEKRYLGALAATMLALTALKAGDQVQWLGFTDRVEFFSPPKRSEQFVWGAFQKLLAHQPHGLRTHLWPVLDFFTQTHRRRSLLVVITDGFWQDKEASLYLRAMAQKHFVVVLYVRHAQETRSLPFGRLPYREVETQTTGVVAGDLEPPTFPQASLRQALIVPEAPLWHALQRVFAAPLL